MQDTVGIFVLGTAGCGKSTLVAAMANWMDQGGLPNQIVNLDPGSDLIPYEPDVDVRDWITLADVMEEYKLGPNGAQIVAADMLAIYKSRIKSSLDLTDEKYILFDTPGQMELFTFREAAKEIVSSLVPQSYLLYLIDPFNARTPSGFVSQLMLSSLSRLRFQIPSLEVLSKADMMDPEMIERINRWQNYPDILMNDLLEETRASPSLSTELAVGINRTLEDLGVASKLFPVSSANGTGIDRIYEVVQLTYGAGDDLPVSDGDLDESMPL